MRRTTGRPLGIGRSFPALQLHACVLRSGVQTLTLFIRDSHLKPLFNPLRFGRKDQILNG